MDLNIPQEETAASWLAHNASAGPSNLPCEDSIYCDEPFRCSLCDAWKGYPWDWYICPCGECNPGDTPCEYNDLPRKLQRAQHRDRKRIREIRYHRQASSGMGYFETLESLKQWPQDGPNQLIPKSVFFGAPSTSNSIPWTREADGKKASMRVQRWKGDRVKYNTAARLLTMCHCRSCRVYTQELVIEPRKSLKRFVKHVNEGLGWNGRGDTGARKNSQYPSRFPRWSEWDREIYHSADATPDMDLDSEQPLELSAPHSLEVDLLQLLKPPRKSKHYKMMASPAAVAITKCSTPSEVSVDSVSSWEALSIAESSEVEWDDCVV